MAGFAVSLGPSSEPWRDLLSFAVDPDDGWWPVDGWLSSSLQVGADADVEIRSGRSTLG